MLSNWLVSSSRIISKPFYNLETLTLGLVSMNTLPLFLVRWGWFYFIDSSSINWRLINGCTGKIDKSSIRPSISSYLLFKCPSRFLQSWSKIFLLSSLLDIFAPSLIRVLRCWTCCCSCRQNILFPFIWDSNTNYLYLAQLAVVIVVHTTTFIANRGRERKREGDREKERERAKRIQVLLPLSPSSYANFTFSPPFIRYSIWIIWRISHSERTFMVPDLSSVCKHDASSFPLCVFVPKILTLPLSLSYFLSISFSFTFALYLFSSWTICTLH